MLFALKTSTCSAVSDLVVSPLQASGWLHAQSWSVDQHRPGNTDPRRYRQFRPLEKVAEPDMEDRPPPVPPKDTYRGPKTSPPSNRGRTPYPLQYSPPRAYHSTTNETHLSVQQQPQTSYTSYTYPPGNYVGSAEVTSAPSTRTEFADAHRHSPGRQRGSELYLPMEEELTPRALTFRRPTSPAESQRTVSTLRRSVSSYSAAEFSPSNYSPSVHYPASPADLGRAATFRSQSTWAGPSPLSPLENRDHWAQSSYPPLRSEERRGSAWTASEEPFEDASQFHLFAEATAGLGPLEHNRQSIISPVATRGNTHTSGQDPRFLSHSAFSPRSVSVPPQLPQEFYAPRIARDPVQRRQTLQHGRPREAQETSEAFAEALTGFGPEGEVGPEDELPDYAQSQREAQQRQRRAAAQRAQELEQRWAKARRAAQSRG